ncbi:hypothetical protein BDK51DRAFT_21038, partial [Blyttiomyces helicus]
MPSRPSSPTVPTAPEHPPSVDFLNTCLDNLASTFPDAELLFVRDLLLTNVKKDYGEWSLGWVVDFREARREWVRDRKDSGYPRAVRSRIGPFAVVPPSERFRSPEYCKGVRYRLYNEFPDHWKSTIKAVMAETNSDYVLSYQKLEEIPPNSWWASLFRFAKRAKRNSPETTIPEVLVDVAARDRVLRDRACAGDREIAAEINDAEYAALGELITCGCCFGDVAFEALAACEDGHVFCVSCVRTIVREGLFGAGALRGCSSVPCPSQTDCDAGLARRELERVLEPDMFRLWQESVAEEEIKRAGLIVVKCPFCPYAGPADIWSQRTRHVTLPSPPVTKSPSSPLFGMQLSSLLTMRPIPFTVASAVKSGAIRRLKSRLTARHRARTVCAFTCRNPVCAKSSCRRCLREWIGAHQCHQKQQDAFRLFVEARMSQALIRVCPVCRLRFNKKEGCNKMVVSWGRLWCGEPEAD